MDYNEMLVKAARKNDRASTQHALKNSANVLYCDNNGDTAMSLVIKSRDLLLFELLIGETDVNATDYTRHTALMRASIAGCCEMVPLLLEKGANPMQYVPQKVAHRGNITKTKWQKEHS